MNWGSWQFVPNDPDTRKGEPLRNCVDGRRRGTGVSAWLILFVLYSATPIRADEPVPTEPSPAPRSVTRKDAGKARASGTLEPPRGDRPLSVRSVDAQARASLRIPPPVRYDFRLLRVQDAGQPPAAPEDQTTPAPPAAPDDQTTPAPPAPQPRLVPDLDTAAAERALGGGEPTAATAQAAPPESATTLLMRALALEDSPVRVYGWIQNSYTYNANGRPANGQNFGVNPNSQANRWMGNQYYLIFENPLEQNDSVNFGFRVDNMFGNDWQFNYMQGLFNRAFPPGHFAGYDLSQLYGEVHLPILTPGGLDVKAGLWYTLAGYEQVPAIARPLLSVPYMFNLRPVPPRRSRHDAAPDRADQPVQRLGQRLGPLDR